MIGAIVGEHTYNIDVFDSLQGYYVKALQYAEQRSVASPTRARRRREFFARPAVRNAASSARPTTRCGTAGRRSGTRKFVGKIVDGRLIPDDRFSSVFFKPAFAGQTFGLGQLSPVAALMVTDVVHAKSGLPLLDIDRASEVYRGDHDPDTSLHYIAAQIRVSIDIYKRIAGFDISQNPGITATLYNLGDVGDPGARAAGRPTTSARRRASRRSIRTRISTAGWSTTSSTSCGSCSSAPTLASNSAGRALRAGSAMRT